MCNPKKFREKMKENQDDGEVILLVQTYLMFILQFLGLNNKKKCHIFAFFIFQNGFINL